MAVHFCLLSLPQISRCSGSSRQQRTEKHERHKHAPFSLICGEISTAIIYYWEAIINSLLLFLGVKDSNIQVLNLSRLLFCVRACVYFSFYDLLLLLLRPVNLQLYTYNGKFKTK